MEPILIATVYTADHGYAWSNVPAGMEEDELDALLNLATDGADELSAGAIRRGVTANTRHAAAFSVRSLPHWDSEGRSALYAALVLFPCLFAERIDVARLLADPFFESITRTPAESVVYTGPAAAEFPLDAPGRLLSQRRIDRGFDPRAVGSLLKRHGANADAWTFILLADGSMSVRTTPWHPAGNRQ